MGLAKTERISCEFIRINTGRDNFIDQHNVHNYAEMRNRGLVAHGVDYNALHPFVRGNWSGIMRGEIPVVGLTRDVNTNASATRDGVLQANDAAALRNLDSWLKGGTQPQAAVRFAPQAPARQHTVFDVAVASSANLGAVATARLLTSVVRDQLAATPAKLARQVLAEIGAEVSRRGEPVTQFSSRKQGVESVLTWEGATLRARAYGNADGLGGISIELESGLLRRKVAASADKSGGTRLAAIVEKMDPLTGDWSVVSKEF